MEASKEVSSYNFFQLFTLLFAISPLSTYIANILKGFIYEYFKLHNDVV
jgi:hypothetical protein